MEHIRAFHVVELGARHAKENLPLQDAAFSENSEISDITSKYTGKYAIAIISDGHGSPQYFRSDRGSKFAYTAAVKAFTTMMSKASDITTPKNQANLKKLIYQNWFDLVKENSQQEPFTEEEFGKLKQKQLLADSKDKAKIQTYLKNYHDGKAIQKAYGCTLIAVLVCEKYTIAVQIGDGTCVAFYDDGTCNQPIPSDPKSMANQTSSLCDLNTNDCRIHIFERKPVAIFVASDGIDDSFGQGEGLYNFYRKICINFAQNGVDYKEQLQAGLSEISQRHSKDDISIAGIYNEDELIKLKDIIKKMYTRGEKLIKLNELKDTQVGVSDYSLNTAKINMEKLENAAKQDKTEINNRNRIIDFLNRDITDIINEFISKKIPEKKKEREEKIKQFNQKISEIDDEILKYEEEIQRLQEKRHKFKNFVDDLSQKHNKIEKNKKTIQEKKEEILRLQSQMETDEARLSEAQKTYQTLLKRKKDGEQTYTQLNHEISELSEEISTQQKELVSERVNHEKLKKMGIEEKTPDTATLSADEEIRQILENPSATATAACPSRSLKEETPTIEEQGKESSMHEENITAPMTEEQIKNQTFEEAVKFGQEQEQVQNQILDNSEKNSAVCTNQESDSGNSDEISVFKTEADEDVPSESAMKDE